MKKVLSFLLITALIVTSMTIAVSAAATEWLEPVQISITSAKTNPGTDYFCGIPGEAVESISADGNANFVFLKNTNRCLYLRWDISGFTADEISKARVMFTADTGSLDLYSLPETEWNTTTAPLLTNATAITKTDSTDEVPTGYTYNRKYDITDAVKAAINNSQQYFVLVIGPKNGNHSYAIYIKNLNVDKQKPALQIQRSTNKSPVVVLDTQDGETQGLDFANEIIVTATGTDANEGETETLTYEFFIDGVANTDNVSGNILTIPGGTLSPGTHTVKVTCTDINGAYTNAEIKLDGYINTFSDMVPVEITGTFANGKSGGVLSASSTEAGIKYDSEYHYVIWSDEDEGLLYIKFPLEDIKNNDVTQAIMNLSIKTWENASQINFYEVLNDWNIGDLIPQTNMETVIGTASISSPDGYTVAEIDVTELVKTALNDGKSYLNIAAAVDTGYFKVPNHGEDNKLIVTNNTNLRPEIVINSPIGDYIGADENINFSVTATDTENNLADVKLYMDNVEITSVSVNGAVYSASVMPTAEIHVLKAVATDAKG